MMHFRQRTLIVDEKQRKRFEKKYSKWRRGAKRYKYFRLVCKKKL